MRSFINGSRFSRIVTSEDLYKCPMCSVAPNRPNDLERHIFIHTGEKPYVCNQSGCGKGFGRSNQLSTHMGVHTGDKPHKCQQRGCDKSFTIRSKLRQHEKGVHSRASAPDEARGVLTSLVASASHQRTITPAHVRKRSLPKPRVSKPEQDAREPPQRISSYMLPAQDLTAMDQNWSSSRSRGRTARSSGPTRSNTPGSIQVQERTSSIGNSTYVRADFNLIDPALLEADQLQEQAFTDASALAPPSTGHHRQHGSSTEKQSRDEAQLRQELTHGLQRETSTKVSCSETAGVANMTLVGGNNERRIHGYHHHQGHTHTHGDQTTGQSHGARRGCSSELPEDVSTGGSAFMEDLFDFSRYDQSPPAAHTPSSAQVLGSESIHRVHR